jgi:glyoxylate reductase
MPPEPESGKLPKPNLLVARDVFPEVLAQLAQHFSVHLNPGDQVLDNAQMIAALQGMQALFATPSEQITGDVLRACPQLRMIGLMAVGYNNVDLDAATACGVMVSNTPDVLTETTADFAWALLLATARRVTESEAWLRAGHWQDWRYDGFLGQDVHGSTLGILGMGRIGQAIARRAAGFCMTVLYHNRQPLPPLPPTDLCKAQWVDKATLLAKADHLVLMLPYSAATRHIIGAQELSQMKPSATLINLARGGIVDDEALIEALRTKRLFAAGLDVFENEPRLHPGFLTLSNVVLTPHIGSASMATRRKMAQRAAHNLIMAFGAGSAPDLLNPAAQSIKETGKWRTFA